MRKLLIIALVALFAIGCLTSGVFAQKKLEDGKKKFFFSDEKQPPGSESTKKDSKKPQNSKEKDDKKSEKSKKAENSKKSESKKPENVTKKKNFKEENKAAAKTKSAKPKKTAKAKTKKSSNEFIAKATPKKPVISKSKKNTAKKTGTVKVAKAEPKKSAVKKASKTTVKKPVEAAPVKVTVEKPEAKKETAPPRVKQVEKTDKKDDEQFNLNPVDTKEAKKPVEKVSVNNSPKEVIVEVEETDSTITDKGAQSREKAGDVKKSPDVVGQKLPDKNKGEEETPKITAVEIKGNKHITTEDIMKVIRSKIGDPLLEPRIRSDIQAIYEMGFFTDVKVDTPYYNGGKKLVFRVQENPLIKKITIMGNKMVPTSKIVELMQTKEGKILNMKTLNTDMMEINYYYDESLGYQLKPTHIKDVNYTSEGELIMRIQEGMPIGRVEVKGSTLFPEDKLLSFVTLKKGELLNTKQVSESCNNIAKYYDEEGYILNPPRPQVNFKDKVVTIQLVEAVVEDIKVEITPVKGRSKVKTKKYVVLRNIRTQKGEILQKKKLKRDIERLNNLGYFSRVDMDPEPGSKPGNLILVFKMQEQKTGMATIGLGYQGGGSGALRSGITGALSYSEKNLGGTGQGAAASWQRGVNVDSLVGSYSNPAINKNQDSISVSAYRNNYYELKQPLSNDIDNDSYALYDDKRYGGNIVYGRRITDDFRLFFSFKHESVEIARNKNSDYQPTGVSKGNLNAGGLGALYDTRNDIFDPTEGFYADGAATLAGGMFGGKYDYQKYQVELRKYFPIGKKKKSTIALRAWGGIIKGKEEEIPVTETFYVGGTDTIRGYNQNEFYGTRMVVLNAEYRFPIANIKFLKGAVFADAGNAWFPGDKNKKLYTDAGAGLRIVFPTLSLGVIRLDYSSGERGGKTSIGIGQTF